ncbi:MAG: hypothetical protein Tsb005_17700 [Gammaproteobacteria bacterium]
MIQTIILHQKKNDLRDSLNGYGYTMILENLKLDGKNLKEIMLIFDVYHLGMDFLTIDSNLYSFTDIKNIL